MTRRLFHFSLISLSWLHYVSLNLLLIIPKDLLQNLLVHFIMNDKYDGKITRKNIPTCTSKLIRIVKKT